MLKGILGKQAILAFALFMMPVLPVQGNDLILPEGLEESIEGLEEIDGLEEIEGLEFETLEEEPFENTADDFQGETDNIVVWSGFWDNRVGSRLTNDPHETSLSLAETRLRLDATVDFDAITLNLGGDAIYDHQQDNQRLDLEAGQGLFDLRAANLVISPTDQIDLKFGRQTLTWGTGDLMFINDLFPKDWKSFFLGRDDEYLKAPSDALKISAFSDVVNLDIVYTPRFDADRFLDGRRVSYYSSNSGQIVGRDGGIVVTDQPDGWFTDDEIALRLYRHLGAFEVTAYGYNGRWKSPEGQDANSGHATFPKLAVYGGSVRGPVGSGIANFEAGYYHSREDGDPLVRDSELRILLGYEREVARNLTGSVQWYVESVSGDNRHVLTTRLTYLTHNQNVIWSLFGFVSPTDSDGYLRPKVTYKIDDSWTVEGGGNIFFGRDRDSFFGQFRNNSNAFVALRYGF